MLKDQWRGHCRSLERTLGKDNDSRIERGWIQETLVGIINRMPQNTGFFIMCPYVEQCQPHAMLVLNKYLMDE